MSIKRRSPYGPDAELDACPRFPFLSPKYIGYTIKDIGRIRDKDKLVKFGLWRPHSRHLLAADLVQFHFFHKEGRQFCFILLFDGVWLNCETSSFVVAFSHPLIPSSSNPSVPYPSLLTTKSLFSYLTTFPHFWPKQLKFWCH